MAGFRLIIGARPLPGTYFDFLGGLYATFIAIVTNAVVATAIKDPSLRLASQTLNMASPASESGEEPKKNLEQITFRFCSEW
jgi:hypothetical protein